MVSTTLLDVLSEIELPQLTAADVVRRCEASGKYLLFAVRVENDGSGPHLEYDRVTQDFPSIDLPAALSLARDDFQKELRRCFVPQATPQIVPETKPPE